MKHLHIAFTAMAFALSGCADSFAAVETTNSPQTTRATVFDDLSLDIPTGYCLNGKYSERTQDQMFALIHSCNANAAKGFYTLSIRKMDAGFGQSNIQAIKSLLADPSGQSVMTDVIVEQKTIGNIHFVRSQKTGRPVVPLTERDYWRSFFIRNGNLYTVSFLPVEGSKLSSPDRLRLVQSYSRKLKR